MKSSSLIPHNSSFSSHSLTSTQLKTLIEQQRPQVEPIATEMAAKTAEKFLSECVPPEVRDVLLQETLDQVKLGLTTEIESRLKSQLGWELQRLGLEVQNVVTQDEAG